MKTETPRDTARRIATRYATPETFGGLFEDVQAALNAERERALSDASRQECVFLTAPPEAPLRYWIEIRTQPIQPVGNGAVGIDPGFKSLLALSTGEKIEHPRELQWSALRLAQAQRGHNKALTARIQEHVANQRKDRNHKLSRRLVSENQFIG